MFGMTRLLNLSSKIFEKKLWFLGLCEYFFLSVDIVSVVNASQSESLDSINANVSVWAADSARGISPELVFLLWDRIEWELLKIWVPT